MGSLAAKRMVLWHAQAGKCFYCLVDSKLDGKPLFTVDHVLASEHNGKTKWGNLVGACHTCNGSKQSRPVEVWLESKDFHAIWLNRRRHEPKHERMTAKEARDSVPTWEQLKDKVPGPPPPPELTPEQLATKERKRAERAEYKALKARWKVAPPKSTIFDKCPEVLSALGGLRQAE